MIEIKIDLQPSLACKLRKGIDEEVAYLVVLKVKRAICTSTNLILKLVRNGLDLKARPPAMTTRDTSTFFSIKPREWARTSRW